MIGYWLANRSDFAGDSRPSHGVYCNNIHGLKVLFDHLVGPMLPCFRLEG